MALLFCLQPAVASVLTTSYRRYPTPVNTRVRTRLELMTDDAHVNLEDDSKEMEETHALTCTRSWTHTDYLDIERLYARRTEHESDVRGCARPRGCRS